MRLQVILKYRKDENNLSNYGQTLWHERAPQKLRTQPLARTGPQRSTNRIFGTIAGGTNYERSLCHERRGQRTTNRIFSTSSGQTNYERSLWHERRGPANYKHNLRHEREPNKLRTQRRNTCCMAAMTVWHKLFDFTQHKV